MSKSTEKRIAKIEALMARGRGWVYFENAEGVRMYVISLTPDYATLRTKTEGDTTAPRSEFELMLDNNDWMQPLLGLLPPFSITQVLAPQ